MKKLVLLIVSGIILNANEYESSKDIIKNTNQSLENIQKNIDREDLKKNDIVEQFSNISIKLDNIKNENKKLEELNSIDDEKIKKIDYEIKNIDQTKNAILPLMEKMVIALERLIQTDTPFLLEKRAKRVNDLKELLTKASISNFIKYEKIMQIYEIEYDYSNTIDSYQDEIDGVSYEFLRVGRVGLYYESLDKTKYGFWNNKTKSWQEIDSIMSKSSITKGIKMAKKHLSPTLLSLPFFSSKDLK